VTVPARPRFVVLEPSKVGNQHITLIEGYLRALLQVDLDARGLDLVYRADPSSHAALAPDVGGAVMFEPVAVQNPEARRWVSKVAQEVALVREAVSLLRAGDLLLVTCLSSPSLLLLELANRFLRDAKLTVVLHGEVEALFDPSTRSVRRWGFWSWQWSQRRRPGSRLRLAVIAGFIRDALSDAMPQTLSKRDIRVLPFPVSPHEAAAPREGAHRAIFIGYRTRYKGFHRFAEVAKGLSGGGVEFLTVGDGKVEQLPSGDARAFEGGFLAEVARASVAVFPYEGGYVASLSAAALDAVSTGVHILATRRPCFQSLASELGDDFVTLFDTDEEMQRLLADRSFLDRVRAGAPARRAVLEQTPYGLAHTRAAFAAMLDESGYPLPGEQTFRSAA
jgi:glycosyltransferase involved in cell wall biosynthesis